MPVLSAELRRQLESVIIAARIECESAARSALQKRGVDAPKPFEHFTPAERTLRNQLRARGRQVGDRRSESGAQEIEQLSQELAYEYWHRMLFARFLAENHLLMHPDKVAVSLAECDQLAPSEGAPNGFVLAARYASRMLPQIFRTDDVLLEIEFPANDRIPLEKLLASLPAETFTADDSLGWVYQFWQSKRKDEVNAKGNKIDARSISAVTQLFTEHYMVLFLLHNTIGAWHAGKVLAANPKLAESAASEDELRKAVALDTAGGYSFDYLRLVRGADGTSGPWRPAAGTFSGWPKTAAELKMLDPCCGSGHFLVAGFELLVRFRMAEESLNVAAAIDAVLRDNLHGLELDARCTQIAAFNLAMAAWKLNGGWKPLPPVNVACTGRQPVASADDWLKAVSSKLANLSMRDRDPIKLGLRHLHDLFTDGPTLGSLIDVSGTQGIGAAEWREIEPFVDDAMQFERDDAELFEEGVTARGLADAARILAGPQAADPGAADLSDVGYNLVITNVPYLGRGKQDAILQAWAEQHEPDAKADLATMFISRSFRWLANGGSVAIVSPQNWLFLTTYKKLRERLLRDQQWNVVARLGSGAFETIGGAVVNVVLLSLSHVEAADDHAMLGIDVAATASPADKGSGLREQADLCLLLQGSQKANPDSRLTLSATSETALLANLAYSHKGISTNDDPQFVQTFWENSVLGSGWEYLCDVVDQPALWSGRTSTIFYQHGVGRLRELNASQDRDRGRDLQGKNAWGKCGIAINLMSNLNPNLYAGEKFLANVSPIISTDTAFLPAIFCFCSSRKFAEAVRVVDQKLAVTNATIVKVPFDLAYWQQVAAEKYPNGLPEPESDDPTQWLFHGRPEVSTPEDGGPLQVAIARLAGYRWPAELDEKMRLSERARALVKRCDELLKFADDDGILPIPAMRGENPLAERVTELLAAAYGKDWSPTVLHKLLADAGMKAGASLDDWLRNGFFEQHCKLFHHRPFIWHIWDGRKDGFNVLVNYHRLDHKRLESLTHAYLGDWISKQLSDAKAGETGADLRLAAAQALHEKLQLILHGEKPYDIFVRWKALKDQPIGWNPDLNDGVRMNIRPFVEAGVLRRTPNIKWTKDRGKDPESAPWFSVFKGERINDYHVTLAEKRKARGE